MQLSSGYALQFENGGIIVRKGARILYTNAKPIYLFVLDYCCITRFFDAAYTKVAETADSVIASALRTAIRPAAWAFPSSAA